ncbi:hypothetical protein F0225_17865 [Vibrio pectenicida]|uniref:Uncharacterized protein n=1 Tax=Vibrio pectenicida TaxID=62763 RepID=A0A7Y4EG74_9VIBR|nr:hypothetical protein [Vibrio pectenicida]NOH73188.1 hypothetical protein [Vibrio pectenicida]
MYAQVEKTKIRTLTYNRQPTGNIGRAVTQLFTNNAINGGVTSFETLDPITLNGIRVANNAFQPLLNRNLATEYIMELIPAVPPNPSRARVYAEGPFVTYLADTLLNDTHQARHNNHWYEHNPAHNLADVEQIVRQRINDAGAMPVILQSPMDNEMRQFEKKTGQQMLNNAIYQLII